MKHKYTAKIQFVDGETLFYSADEVDELWRWMKEQTEGSFEEVHGDILDKATMKVIKHFHYVPPE